MIQELYFNSTFGPNQLKTSYHVDWELQELDVELQEYFFNLNDQILTEDHIVRKDDWLSTKLSRLSQVKLEIKIIQQEFISCFDKGQQNGNVFQNGVIDSPARETPGQVDSSMSRLNKFKSADAKIRLGLTINKSSAKEEKVEQDEQSEKKSKYVGPDYVLNKFHMNESLAPLSKLLKVLEKIKELVNNDGYKEYQGYIQVSTGYIIMRCSNIVLQLGKTAENNGFSTFKSRFKSLVGDLLFDSKIYLSMFSRHNICSLIQSMPNEAIVELIKVQNIKRVYLSCFKGLIRVFYRWIIIETDRLKSKSSDEDKDKFFNLSWIIMIFFNKLIEENIEINKLSFQKELLYFDFLFMIYQYSGASDMLKRYSTFTDHSPKTPLRFQTFISDVSKNHKQAIIEGNELNENGETNQEYLFLKVLIYSMGFTTRRFFITETSDLISKNIGYLINDLTAFTDIRNGEDFSEDDGSSFHMINGLTEVGPIYEEKTKELEKNKEDRGFVELQKFCKSSQKFSNKYYYGLFHLVVHLQTNLLVNTDENLLDNIFPEKQETPLGKLNIDWRLNIDQILDVVKMNLMLLLSAGFKDKRADELHTYLFGFTYVEVANQLKNIVDKIRILKVVGESSSSYKVDDDGQDLISIRSAKINNKSIVTKFVQIDKILKVVISNLKNENESYIPTASLSETAFLDLIDSTKEMITILSKFLHESDSKAEGIEEEDQKVHLSVMDKKIEMLKTPEDSEVRRSLYRSQMKLEFMQMSTMYSRKYNHHSGSDQQCYYKQILTGKVEMEVDAKELRSGLARSFIKVFNKMLFNVRDIKDRFKKIADNVDKQTKILFNFLIPLEGSRYNCDDDQNPDKFQAASKLILSIETSYFYNETFRKSIILFEKLLDEIPELKKLIYLESFKNRRVVQRFQKLSLIAHEKLGLPEPTYRPFHMFPYLQNMTTLSLQLSHCLGTSLFLHEQSGIIASNLFIVMSLLNNLNQDNFEHFKVEYVQSNFDDSRFEWFKEESVKDKTVAHSRSQHVNQIEVDELKPLNLQGGNQRKPKPTQNNEDESEEEDKHIFLDSKAVEKEQQTPNLLMSVCCRIEQTLSYFKLNDKNSLATAFEDPILLTTLPLITMWVNFLESSMAMPHPVDKYEDRRLYSRTDLLICYMYKKLCITYFLKMLFAHSDMTHVEVVYFKKSIAAFIFKIARHEKILEHILKYHYDFRTIYDYTILVTKMHVSSLLEADEVIRKSLRRFLCCKKAKDEADVTKDKIDGNLEMFLSKFIDIRMNTAKAMNIGENLLPKNLVYLNSSLFGGCNFHKIVSSKEFSKKGQDFAEEANIKEIMEIYKKSDNRDLGFQFIHSLVKIMMFIEASPVGWKLWSNKKEAARVQFEVEPTKLTKNREYEFKIVYFLSMISKQIEVVNQDGKNVLICFRKYPEIYTLESLNPLELIGEFKFEDFKRDVCKIIPELYVKTNIQYSIMQKMGFMYQFLKSDTSKKHPVILWFFSVILNLVIFIGYENYAFNDDTHTLSNIKYKIAEMVFAYFIMTYAALTIIFWLTTRYYIVRRNSAKAVVSTDAQGSDHIDTFNLLELKGIFSFIIDNPYFKFIREMFFNADMLCLIFYFMFAALGWWLHPVGYVGSLGLFAFFNKTTRSLLSAITSNWWDIVLTMVLIFLTAYIYTILQFFYFYDNFDPQTFGNSKPCVTLYSCYMNVINYGIRLGGGLGEATSYVPEYSTLFEVQFLFNLTFFFFINIIALNMLFGIIIDGFGKLRDKEFEMENALSRFCLVCSIQKTDLEAKGIDFFFHTNIQHNIEDYVAYMIRLHINSHNLQHDLDFVIWSKILRYNISWFPNLRTKFLQSTKQGEIEEKSQNEKMLDNIKRAEADIQASNEFIHKIDELINQYSGSPYQRSSRRPSTVRHKMTLIR